MSGIEVSSEQVRITAVPIPAGATGLSAGINLGKGRIARIDVPAGWVAGVMTIAVSSDAGATYLPLFNADGTEYTLNVASGRATLVPLIDLLSVQWVQLRSGTSATPINQTGAPIINVVTAP